MKNSIIPELLRKDLELSWPLLAVAAAGGAASLLLWQFAGQTLRFTGIVGYFIVLVMLGIIPMMMIINERKKQTLAFVMSLPITASQYAFAKLLAAFGMFVIPWLVLAVVALSMIVGRADVPNGFIPLAVILMLVPLLGFLIQISVAIVSESEARSVFAMGAVNVSYSFVWVGISTTPALTQDLPGATPVWNSTVMSVLGTEISVIAIVFLLTLFLQSRKRDFV